MPDAAVTIHGLDELQRALRATDAQMARALHDGLQAGGQTVRAEAQRRVPYRTGKLSRAIRPGPVRGSGARQYIEIGIAPGGGSPSRGPSGAKGLSTNPGRTRNTSDPRVYGPVVEHGSGPHIIRPTAKKALAFTVGGVRLVRRSVHHPGTRAHPFLVPALTENERLIAKRVMDRVEAVLRTIGRRTG